MTEYTHDVFHKEEICERMMSNLKGVDISLPLLNLIIETYNTEKRSILMEGGSIVEPGLGTIKIFTRRVPSSFSSKQFTVKASFDLESSLKSALVDKANSDPDFKASIGG